MAFACQIKLTCCQLKLKISRKLSNDNLVTTSTHITVTEWKKTLKIV